MPATMVLVEEAPAQADSTEAAAAPAAEGTAQAAPGRGYMMTYIYS
jgi:hypothetical protein